MVFSDKDKILIKHISTIGMHSYTYTGIKIGALKNLFTFSSISAEYLQTV